MSEKSLNPIKSAPANVDKRIAANSNLETQVGVFFMPSWNTSSDPKVDVDSFWACLQGRGECAFVKDPLIWGSNGRIFNRQYPYDGPFLVKKPHPSLKGFYKRDDPQVAQKQIQYMKDYGIDFFVYKWFFGRHYYYHLDYAPQSTIFYPKGWPTDSKRSGRVKVPGIELLDRSTELAKKSGLPGIKFYSRHFWGYGESTTDIWYADCMESERPQSALAWWGICQSDVDARVCSQIERDGI